MVSQDMVMVIKEKEQMVKALQNNLLVTVDLMVLFTFLNFYLINIVAYKLYI